MRVYVLCVYVHERGGERRLKGKGKKEDVFVLQFGSFCLRRLHPKTMASFAYSSAHSEMVEWADRIMRENGVELHLADGVAGFEVVACIRERLCTRFFFSNI